MTDSALINILPHAIWSRDLVESAGRKKRLLRWRDSTRNLKPHLGRAGQLLLATAITITTSLAYNNQRLLSKSRVTKGAGVTGEPICNIHYQELIKNSSIFNRLVQTPKCHPCVGSDKAD
jgi:hypothetical protein